MTCFLAVSREIHREPMMMGLVHHCSDTPILGIARLIPEPQHAMGCPMQAKSRPLDQRLTAECGHRLPSLQY
jgi:hypothetical protein